MNISIFFERDLDKLIAEINLFKNESDIWRTKEGINNSAGNLTLHLLGNLNHFIGKTLGNTDYMRNRVEEFSLKNVTMEKLISDLNELKGTIKNTLSKLSKEESAKGFSDNNERRSLLYTKYAHLFIGSFELSSWPGKLFKENDVGKIEMGKW